MPKKINTKLTTEQEKIMFEEETELPGSSSLNYEKKSTYRIWSVFDSVVDQTPLPAVLASSWALLKSESEQLSRTLQRPSCRGKKFQI